MKEVYIVTRGDYSDYTICQVFDDKELADEFAEQVRGQVEIFEITNELNYAKGIRGYRVDMEKYGEVKSVSLTEVNSRYAVDAVYPAPTYDIFKLQPDGSLKKAIGKRFSYGMFFVNTDMGEEGAIKIANERRAIMIANNVWPYND